ncbi:hypothetical protein EG240_05485 [Paenimyroides tangerinum]|uniref:Alpha-ketoglutarate decarboxylase n=1 Tax=Paenimyroides tangerinum TaxID=2488728 RepID=A0A3P3WGI8_9FLAO|nr:hypothetical protein [Paenimyroides tangerinum]RRJ91653.1 hypothetical protein EG240_05485 [Paenimyroides tangerinum]
MKKIIWILLFSGLLGQNEINAQIVHPQNNEPRKIKSDFFERVQFGGGLGLSFGNNFTDIAIAPSGIYHLTDKVAVGVGLQYNYVESKDYYRSSSYGINLIGLYTPIPQFQLSAELEQLRVNNSIDLYSGGYYYGKFKDNFWNTGLFLGAGYRTSNVTVGIRYNVLYKRDNFVYSQAWMPFVRVYF